ncbi:GNAT family N-acetyltransferase [Streptomyces sp. SL13]|uniref:GNAT family N-acetyltransferase n=1 Tax=Streptantibioticus silvisoli TaxID=2705255 RepID=A0AA90H5S6_9ACTN|nr:GNAT family N-acetyltransferase [Streptantibioticus silvisoli]MDI5974064.1 GNAT family N-acetyltransferase [Streptantibioticus silvisoli]
MGSPPRVRGLPRHHPRRCTIGVPAGICELSVRPTWQGKGIGIRIHTALLDAFQPRWSSPLAMPGNDAAQRVYHRLGYRCVGPYRAGVNGSVLDLLLRCSSKSFADRNGTWVVELGE